MPLFMTTEESHLFFFIAPIAGAAFGLILYSLLSKPLSRVGWRIIYCTSVILLGSNFLSGFVRETDIENIVAFIFFGFLVDLVLGQCSNPWVTALRFLAIFSLGLVIIDVRFAIDVRIVLGGIGLGLVWVLGVDISPLGLKSGAKYVLSTHLFYYSPLIVISNLFMNNSNFAYLYIGTQALLSIYLKLLEMRIRGLWLEVLSADALLAANTIISIILSGGYLFYFLNLGSPLSVYIGAVVFFVFFFGGLKLARQTKN